MHNLSNFELDTKCLLKFAKKFCVIKFNDRTVSDAFTLAVTLNGNLLHLNESNSKH